MGEQIKFPKVREGFYLAGDEMFYVRAPVCTKKPKKCFISRFPNFVFWIGLTSFWHW